MLAVHREHSKCKAHFSLCSAKMPPRSKIKIKTANEFQSKILQLNFHKFIQLTNIRDIAINDCRAGQKEDTNIKSKNVDEKQIEQRIQFYFEKLKNLDEWDNCNLKLLKLQEDDALSINHCSLKRKKVHDLFFHNFINHVAAVVVKIVNGREAGHGRLYHYFHKLSEIQQQL